MFDSFSENSRVWVYTSNRFINTDDEIVIRKHLEDFVSNWNAHGALIKGTYKIYKDYFIVLVADENRTQVSGCSIDSSVKCIKAIGNALNIDFFNRLSLVTENEGEMKRVLLHDLNHESVSFVYDTSVANLADFKTKFKVAKEDYLKRFMVK